MKEKELKHLLSKLTGVNLYKKKVVTAMADVMGALFLKNRQLNWQRYHDGDALSDCPVAMKQEISSIMRDFQGSFAQSLGQMPEVANASVIFAYYAKDPAVSEEQMQYLQNLPKGEEYLQTINFINEHGLRLWMSPNGMHNYVYKTGRKGDTSAVNGSNKFFETFGYAWGAKKAATNKNIRQANYLTPEKLEAIRNDPEKQSQLEESDVRVVQVVTAEKNGAYGIFFSDGNGLIPVIGDNYYASANIKDENDQSFVDKAKFVASKGQHKKFFGLNTADSARGKILTLPTQTQYTLQTPNDPNPQPVRKGGGDLGKSSRYSRYYIWPKNDGTLWWINATQTSRINNSMPLTKEQVDSLNVENNNYYLLSNPDKFVYSWETIDPISRPKVEQNYHQVTGLMNEIYDALMTMNPDKQPHVALNAFKYCIIGPAFKQGANVDQKETAGRNPYSTTYLRETHDGTNIMRREDWIVVANEFNSGRAASTGNHGFQVAQSIDGLNALSGSMTLEDALKKAFSLWEINAPYPDENEIQAAQDLFDKLHYPELFEPQPVEPQSTGLEENQMQNQQQVMPEVQQNQNQNQPSQPVTPPQGTVNQQINTVQPKKNQWVNSKGNTFANKKSSLSKTSKDVLNNIKKLG
jgi:hypothetical protein